MDELYKYIKKYQEIINKSNISIDNELDELVELYESKYITNYQLNEIPHLIPKEGLHDLEMKSIFIERQIDISKNEINRLLTDIEDSQRIIEDNVKYYIEDDD